MQHSMLDSSIGICSLTVTAWTEPQAQPSLFKYILKCPHGGGSKSVAHLRHCVTTMKLSGTVGQTRGQTDRTTYLVRLTL